MTVTDNANIEASVLPPGTTRPLETLMAVEGRWTGDNRLIMVDGLRWDGILPICLTIDHGNGMETICGNITEIERMPGMTADERFIVGRGMLDLGVSSDGESSGQDAERAIEDGFWRGVSIELDDMDLGGVDPDTVTDPEDEWAMVVESARLRALALVTTPAFAEAYITLGTVDASTDVPAIDGPTPVKSEDMPAEEGLPVVVVASGHTLTIPTVPPAAWYVEPLDVAVEGAWTVTDEGRVYGLLAPDNVGHRGYRRGSERVVAPLGTTDYSRFMGGRTIVEGGGRIATGNVTFECGHGPEGGSQEHYDNSCSIAATIAVGERTEAPYGVWVAGALMPGITPEQVQRMMACRLSGHWEPSEESSFTHELIAALLVPVPGFAASGKPMVTVRDGTLIASAVPVRFGGCDCEYGLAAALDEVREMVERIDARTAPLMPLAAAAIRASVKD